MGRIWVLKEVFQQFSAGMQTIAVIPILPHGVVQLGSYMAAMMENIAFVNDVRSLVLQLGHVPGVLLSENYATKEPAPKIGVPVCLGNSSGRSMLVNSSSFISDSYVLHKQLDPTNNICWSNFFNWAISDSRHSTAAIMVYWQKRATADIK